MERGDMEQNCLDYVRNILRTQDLPDEFNLLLSTAKPNDVLSEFPDFVGNNGIIEHFEVTAGKDNKKGAAIKRADNKLLNMAMKNGFSAGIEPISNYQQFVSSFKKHFEKHLCSFRKYKEANSDTALSVFFMVDNRRNLALQMCEDLERDVSDYSSEFLDEFKNNRYMGLYRLVYDKDLLNYIDALDFKSDIILFVYRGGCDFIDCLHIKDIVADIINKIVIAGSPMVVNTHKTFCFRGDVSEE